MSRIKPGAEMRGVSQRQRMAAPVGTCWLYRCDHNRYNIYKKTGSDQYKCVVHFSDGELWPNHERISAHRFDACDWRTVDAGYIDAARLILALEGSDAVQTYLRQLFEKEEALL